MMWSIQASIIEDGKRKTLNAIIRGDSERAAKWRFICLATSRFGNVADITVNDGTPPHELNDETFAICGG